MKDYKILEYEPNVNINFKEMLLSDAELESIDERLNGFDERTFVENTLIENYGIDLGSEYQDAKIAYGIKQSIRDKNISAMMAIEYLSNIVLNDSFLKNNKEMTLIAIKVLASSAQFNCISSIIHKLVSDADKGLDTKLLTVLKRICDTALSNEIYVCKDISNIKAISNEMARIDKAIMKCCLLGASELEGVINVKEELESQTLRCVINEDYKMIDNTCRYILDKDEYKRLQQILLIFNTCVKQLKDYETVAIDSINSLIEIVGTKFDQVDATSRIGLLCILIIREKYSFHITKILLNDSQETKNYYFSGKFVFINYWLSLRDQQYKSIKEYISVPKPASREWVTSEFLPLLKIWVLFRNIQNLLRVTSFDDEYAYYTSYDTFSLMLPEKCIGDREDECGKLSIMNVGYMNDPNEGLILKQYLFGDNNKNRHSNPIRKLISSPFMFIKSFTSKIDYLPMWKMYGEGGDNKQSVCLIIDLSSLKDSELYHVCYIDKSNNRNPILKVHNSNIDFKEVSASLRTIKNTYKNVTSDEGHSCLEKLINELNYMFKDSSYSYEQEIRLMYKFEESNDEIKKTKQNPKKLFMPSKRPIQIKEIILGPRFENVSDYYPYLQEQLEKMAKETDTKVPIVTMSSIDYR